MPLDTQQFGFSRYWLAVALAEIPMREDVFSSGQLSFARKKFLAGKNQLTAIKNWLLCANILQRQGTRVLLTKLGKLVVAHDARAEKPWTWWLVHLNLCANKDSYPYTTFFTRCFDAEGTSWMSVDDIIEALTKASVEGGEPTSESTTRTYFVGVAQAWRSGEPLHGLGLIERRRISDGSAERLRRRATKPADLVVAYATLLFQDAYFASQTTIETRMLLGKGLGRALGMRDADVREALSRIHQHRALSRFIQYRQAVNLDSVQFLEAGDNAALTIAAHTYTHGNLQWA